MNLQTVEEVVRVDVGHDASLVVSQNRPRTDITKALLSDYLARAESGDGWY